MIGHGGRRNELMEEAQGSLFLTHTLVSVENGIPLSGCLVTRFSLSSDTNDDSGRWKVLRRLW